MPRATYTKTQYYDITPSNAWVKLTGDELHFLSFCVLEPRTHRDYGDAPLQGRILW